MSTRYHSNKPSDDEAVFRAINAVNKYALPEKERELRKAWEKKHKEETDE